jgi:hypothetical protein
VDKVEFGCLNSLQEFLYLNNVRGFLFRKKYLRSLVKVWRDIFSFFLGTWFDGCRGPGSWFVDGSIRYRLSRILEVMKTWDYRKRRENDRSLGRSEKKTRPVAKKLDGKIQ